MHYVMGALLGLQPLGKKNFSTFISTALEIGSFTVIWIVKPMYSFVFRMGDTHYMHMGWWSKTGDQAKSIWPSLYNIIRIRFN